MSFFIPKKVRTFLWLLVILAAVFCVFSPTLKSDFLLWDDDVHLLENISLRALDLEHMGEMLRQTVNQIYIPLTTFSFAIEHHFFGFNPFVYHLDNLLLHLGVVVFVFWLGLRLGMSSFASGIAALLFGIHPIHVESVAWVTERKDVLYSFLYMAALLSYCRYLNIDQSTRLLKEKRAGLFFVLTLIFGTLSMLAKPMALSLPLILLLLDWFFKRKWTRWAFIEKVPVALTVAAITWITYSTHARVPGKAVLEGIMIYAWTLVFYLRQFVFPVFSVPIYKLAQPVALSNPEYALSLGVAVFLIIALIRFRARRMFMFAFAFFFFSIFFLLRYDDAKDVNIVADRFMYLPSVGFCYLIGLGVQRIVQSFKDAPMRIRLGKAIGMIFIVFLTCVLIARAYQQCLVWKNSVSVWQHQLKIFPQSKMALNNLAIALREQEDYKKAEEEYQKILAIRSEGFEVNYSAQVIDAINKVTEVMMLYKQAIEIDDGFVEAHYNLAKLYGDVGKVSEAIDFYKKVLSIDGKYKDAHFNLGEIYRMEGDVARAVYAYDQTLLTYPDDPEIYVNVILAYAEALKSEFQQVIYKKKQTEALNKFVALINKKKDPKARDFFNLGYVYDELGDAQKSISSYRMALEIRPDYGYAMYNLGNTYKKFKHYDEAIEMYKKVIEITPQNADAHLNMGIIYGHKKDFEKALEHYNKAININPNNSKAYFNIGYVKELEKKWPEAIEVYKKAIEADEENADAYYNLGNIYAKQEKFAEAINVYLETVKVDPNYVDAWVNLSILSFKVGDFKKAVTYCDEAVLLGYDAPAGYLRALEPHRVEKK